jgi:hypothetical protein
MRLLSVIVRYVGRRGLFISLFLLLDLAYCKVKMHLVPIPSIQVSPNITFADIVGYIHSIALDRIPKTTTSTSTV